MKPIIHFIITYFAMKGRGLVNNLINNLPFELHLPGYNYCGPGTRLQERLLRGDRGINGLDEACKSHDIAYSNYSDLQSRHNADLELIKMAKRRMQSKHASKGEKISSWLVKNIMKSKVKAGAGLKKFKSAVAKIGRHLKKIKPKSNKDAIKIAYLTAKKIISGDKKLYLPRLIPVPKTGGILPLIPIFAGLSALGAIAGGASGIAKAVNDYKDSKKKFMESERHNKVMEAIAIGKGLYIKPYSHKKGSGLCIHSSKN